MSEAIDITKFRLKRMISDQLAEQGGLDEIIGTLMDMVDTDEIEAMLILVETIIAVHAIRTGHQFGIALMDMEG